MQDEGKQLAESEAVYVNEGSDSSIYTYSKSGGKTKWTFSKPSYLKNKIEKFIYAAYAIRRKDLFKR